MTPAANTEQCQRVGAANPDAVLDLSPHASLVSQELAGIWAA